MPLQIESPILVLAQDEEGESEEELPIEEEEGELEREGTEDETDEL